MRALLAVLLLCPLGAGAATLNGPVFEHQHTPVLGQPFLASAALSATPMQDLAVPVQPHEAAGLHLPERWPPQRHMAPEPKRSLALELALVGINPWALEGRPDHNMALPMGFAILVVIMCAMGRRPAYVSRI